MPTGSRIKTGTSETDSLAGHFLMAMPTIGDDRFVRSVIYMCAHSDEGAMGLIINQPADEIRFSDLLSQLDILKSDDLLDGEVLDDVPIHVGGPVETGRGFVLHSPDYRVPGTTLDIDGSVCLTATVDILKAIAAGSGPEQSILALGYSGWGPGQLEREIQSNGWLHCLANPLLIFDEPPENRYGLALATLGIDPSHLVSDYGHA